MKGFNKLTFVLLPVLLFFSCREEIDCDCDNAVDLRPLTIDEEKL